MSTDAMIDLTIVDGLATISLCRAPVNALSRAMRDELIHLFDMLSGDETVRVIMLRSALPTFCAGVDLREASQMSGPDSRRHGQRLNRELLAAVRDCTVPVIGVLDGPVVGLGVGLILSCDLVLCSPRASIRLTEIDHGRMADLALLRRSLPRAVLARLALCAVPMNAADLLHHGLVSELVEQDIDGHAGRIGLAMAGKSRAVLGATKAALNLVEGLPAREGSRQVQMISDGLVTR